MLFNKFLLLLITFTYVIASNSEIHFSGMYGEALIGVERLQTYTNDLTEEGTMTLRLIIDDEKTRFQLTPMVCRVEKGQFNWTPPSNIKNGSRGYFEYTIEVNGEEFSGQTDKVKFVSEYSSSSTSSIASTTTVTDSHPTNPVNGTSNSTIDAEPETPQITVNSNPNPNPSPIQNQNETSTSDINASNKNSMENVDGMNQETEGLNETTKYLIYIGSGSGLVVMALTGFLIFYKVKSHRNMKDYQFDSRPYNNTSMDFSSMVSPPNQPNFNTPLLDMNGPSTTAMNIMGTPQVFGTMDSINKNGSMHSQNRSIASSGTNMLPTSMGMNPTTTNMGAMMASAFISPIMDQDKSNRNSKRTTYEMISPYDPRETSYNVNFNPYDESMDNIINLNGGGQGGQINIDIHSNLPVPSMESEHQLPPPESYTASSRYGSLPRNKVPHNVYADESLVEDDRKNYRSSILSYISSNRGSFYGDAQAQHSVQNHRLLNQVCTVAYASQPENEDELYLCVGDKVRILEVYDDGWAYSLHLASGLEGMIPLNCTTEYYY